MLCTGAVMEMLPVLPVSWAISALSPLLTRSFPEQLPLDGQFLQG